MRLAATAGAQPQCANAVAPLKSPTLGRWLGRRPLIVPAHPQADTGSHRWKGALKRLASDDVDILIRPSGEVLVEYR